MENVTPMTGVEAHTAAAAAANAVHEHHVHLHMDAAALSQAAPSVLSMDGVVATAPVPSTTVQLTTTTTTTTQNELLPKKTGRPAHPLWAHFHRGEKRNRYHYHAFCVYCAERYGAEQVPPTRGVSIDMLRHLEKCAHCPRRTVEHLKEVCGRRDAVRFDRYGKKKLIQQQQQQQEGDGAVHSEQVQDQTRALVGVTDHVTMIQRHHEQQQQQQEEQFKLAMAAAQASNAEVAVNSAASTPVFLEAPTTTAPMVAPGSVAVAMPSPSLSPASALTSGSIRQADLASPPPSKRIRSDDGVTPLSITNSQIAVLKLAVAAGIPVDALQNQDFQQLLCLLRPSLASPLVPPSETFGQMLEPAFLKETAQRLASLQLDRVKEGMLNSTIKGGLTLSLHLWTTLDGQHLVAFNLVNSNGDSTCVRVEDIANFTVDASASSSFALPHTNTATALQLAAKIEEVLAKLQADNISVMGIVADSTLALNAARRVSLTMNKRQSLLVVPCFSRVLSVLAGAVLSHPYFVDIVGDMIEIAAYLLNTTLLERIRQLSGDPLACFVLPNRENWFSFVDCHSRLLGYRHAIVELCQKGEADVPHVFKTLVLRDNRAVWGKLDELGAFLAPLHETYSVFFQQIRTVAGKTSPQNQDGPSVEILEDDVSAAHGLTLAHVTYQFARMTQLYQSLLLSAAAAPDAQDVAQLVLIHVDTMWRRYELPAMLLAFVFNFHLETTLLDMTKPCSAWPSIAQYFQLYYQRWFAPEQVGSTAAVAEQPTADVAITPERITEILDAIKLNQFPFDPDTTSDYIDVSSFYSFVSDSHPEICALCCRLYAISLLTANASRIVRGIGYVPNAAQTTRDPESVELLLHIGFASSMRRNVFPARSGSNSALGGMEAMIDSGASDAVLWSEDIWQGFADDWRLFVDQELLMDEFDAISNECARDDATAALLAVKVPVQDLFVDTLPAMTVTLETPAIPGLVESTMTAPATVHEAPHAAAATPGVVFSVGI